MYAFFCDNELIFYWEHIRFFMHVAYLHEQEEKFISLTCISWNTLRNSLSYPVWLHGLITRYVLYIASVYNSIHKLKHILREEKSF
jgi:hypothetical protein